MSDDSDSDSGLDKEAFKLYRDRKEWADIKPIKQNDGDVPVVPIAYTESYADIFDYFRGLMAVGEKSVRGLELCTDAIHLNPSNYTVWHYRMQILKNINCDLREELQYVGEVIRESPKNYQVWHHRKQIVEWLNDGSEELDFTAEILSVDAKNYHAWQHRQWVVSEFKLFDREMEYADELLQDDIRNNSAWTYRYYIIESTSGFTSRVIDAEINYCITAVKKAFSNESVWNYLKGILMHAERKLNEPKVLEYVNQKYKDGIRSVHLQIYLFDAIVEDLEASSTCNQEKLNFALQLLTDLSTTYDVIRAKYWTANKDGLKRQYSMVETATDFEPTQSTSSHFCSTVDPVSVGISDSASASESVTLTYESSAA